MNSGCLVNILWLVHHTHSYYTTYPPSTHNTLHAYYYYTYIYMPPHQNPSQFTNIKIQSYIHHTITEWVKPKHKIFTTSAWGKPGQGKHDTDKVPGRPTLLKIPNPPPLKFPLVMIKSSVLKKLLHSLIPSLQTSFATLTIEILVLCIKKNQRKS